MPIRSGNRREKRIAAAFPIRLWGLDANGRPFIEASKTGNVSRSGALLHDVPTQLNAGDIIGLQCEGKKHRFRVVWTGKQGTTEAGNVGLQCLEAGTWIWEKLRLPVDDVDVYTRPPQSERRLVNRAQCFLSAEMVCDGTRVLAFVRDLSLGGCYVATSYLFNLEANVSIGLWLAEQNKIWIDGVVVSRHAGSGMGIKFLGLTRRNFEVVEQFMRELSPQEKSSSVRIWLPAGDPQ